ncbi:MAG: ATP-binding protein [Planctomycetes bacterium]|nr:ATP-binding protein [Planctomycetota bacterium]
MHEAGEINLTVTRADDGLSVVVRNTGPGFPAEQRWRLFRKFSRVQSPELPQQKGTGIGLYTSWRIVRAYGGKIWATSEPGSWAEFSFTIPQPPVQPDTLDIDGG